jgi:hypothetical protein
MKRRKFLKTGLSGSALVAALPMRKLVAINHPDISTNKNTEPVPPSLRLLNKLSRKYGGEFGNVMIKE